MTRCDDVFEALAAGGSPDDAPVAGHLRVCSSCRSLLEVRRSTGGGEDEVAPLYGPLRAEIAAEKGLSAWLRERSTVARIALAILPVVLGLGLHAMLFGPPEIRQGWVAVAAIAATLAICLFDSMRPLHRPSAPRWRAGLAIAAATILPGVLAVIPFARGAAARTFLDALPNSAACFTGGALLSLTVILWWRALDRLAGGGRSHLVLAGAFAGLAGHLFLDWRCPSSDPMHVLIGHASLVLVLVLGALAWASWPGSHESARPV